MTHIPEYLATKELARLLGVTTRTISKWLACKPSKIPTPRQVGCKRIHHVPSVLAAVTKNCLDISAEASQLLLEHDLNK